MFDSLSGVTTHFDLFAPDIFSFWENSFQKLKSATWKIRKLLNTRSIFIKDEKGIYVFLHRSLLQQHYHRLDRSFLNSDPCAPLEDLSHACIGDNMLLLVLFSSLHSSLDAQLLELYFKHKGKIVIYSHSNSSLSPKKKQILRIHHLFQINII